MKRFIAIFLILILALSFVSASAEETDTFSSYSDEALIDLYYSLLEELEARGLSVTQKRTLPEGKYTIGEDILPGNYIITCTGTSAESLGDMYSSLGDAFDSLTNDESMSSLFGSLGSMMGEITGMTVEILGDYGAVLKSMELKTGDSVSVKLEKDTALQISEGSCTLESNSITGK